MDVRLLVFIKAPLPGRVKTRLAASLGQDLALEAYRAMAANVLAAADASNLPATICFDPPETLDLVQSLCGQDRRFLPQVQGDLGARMEAALAQAFGQGAEAALLVGCDLPLLTGDILGQAATRLGAAEAVLGPATDGGYYLIGFTRQGFCHEAFRDMPWSTATVAARTAAVLSGAGRRLALVPELPDCDTVSDLRRLAKPPLRDRLHGTPFGFFLAGLPQGLFDRIPPHRLLP